MRTHASLSKVQNDSSLFSRWVSVSSFPSNFIFIYNHQTDQQKLNLPFLRLTSSFSLFYHHQTLCFTRRHLFTVISISCLCAYRWRNSSKYHRLIESWQCSDQIQLHNERLSCSLFQLWSRLNLRRRSGYSQFTTVTVIRFLCALKTKLIQFNLLLLVIFDFSYWVFFFNYIFSNLLISNKWYCIVISFLISIL